MSSFPSLFFGSNTNFPHKSPNFPLRGDSSPVDLISINSDDDHDDPDAVSIQEILKMTRYLCVRKPPKLNIYLDLDQTILYTGNLHPERYDFKLEFPTTVYFVNLRPHLFYFLQSLHEKCHLYIFTSAMRSYAVAIVQKLGIENIIMNIFSREKCILTSSGHEDVFMKDLSTVGAVLERSVLIDDTNTSMIPQPDNGILVKPFFGDEGDDDTELLSVLDFIQKLLHETDVRKKIRRTKLKARRTVDPKKGNIKEFV